MNSGKESLLRRRFETRGPWQLVSGYDGLRDSSHAGSSGAFNSTGVGKGMWVLNGEASKRHAVDFREEGETGGHSNLYNLRQATILMLLFNRNCILRFSHFLHWESI